MKEMIEKLTGECAEVGKKIVKLTGECAEVDAKITKLKVECTERMAKLTDQCTERFAKLKIEDFERDTKIATLKGECTERFDNLRELEVRCEEQDKKIASLESQCHWIGMVSVPAEQSLLRKFLERASKMIEKVEGKLDLLEAKMTHDVERAEGRTEGIRLALISSLDDAGPSTLLRDLIEMG